MSGITVINTTDFYNIAWWQVILCFVPLVAGSCYSLISLRKAFMRGTAEEKERGVVSYDNWHNSKLCNYTITIGGIISVVLIFCMCYFWPARFVETRYEVAVDCTVSFVEFYDNYSIVEETDHGTFIVKEKQ